MHIRGLNCRHIPLIFATLCAAVISALDVQATPSPITQGASKLSAPVSIIFDTDIWTDIDDTLALAMLHALQDRGEVKLLAVTIGSDDPWCAPYVDLVNTFYGHADVPIGIVHDGLDIAAARKVFPHIKNWPSTRYARVISERKNPDGSFVFPHRVTEKTAMPEATKLLRQVLAAQPDRSVVAVQVGYSTNLARLLDSPADAASSLSGVDLVKKKVRLLSVMGGSFANLTFDGKTTPKGVPEFNLQADVPSAQKLFSRWPTAVIASGLEIGLALRYPGISIERDYVYTKPHPVADTYRFFCEEQMNPKCPHEHPTWDLTSVLYAAQPDRNYFSVSNPGTITVLDNGGTRFEEAAEGLHRYLTLTADQNTRALEALQLLSSQPPRYTPRIEICGRGRSTPELEGQRRSANLPLSDNEVFPLGLHLKPFPPKKLYE